MTSSSHDSTMSSLDSSYLSSGHESSTSADISPVKIPYRSPQHYPVGAYNGSVSKIREMYSQVSTGIYILSNVSHVINCCSSLGVHPYQQAGVRSGYNGSIADILEASGYSSGNEFKVDEQIGSVYTTYYFCTLYISSFNAWRCSKIFVMFLGMLHLACEMPSREC